MAAASVAAAAISMWGGGGVARHPSSRSNAESHRGTARHRSTAAFNVRHEPNRVSLSSALEWLRIYHCWRRRATDWPHMRTHLSQRNHKRARQQGWSPRWKALGQAGSEKTLHAPQHPFKSDNQPPSCYRTKLTRIKNTYTLIARQVEVGNAVSQNRFQGHVRRPHDSSGGKQTSAKMAPIQHRRSITPWRQHWLTPQRWINILNLIEQVEN